MQNTIHYFGNGYTVVYCGVTGTAHDQNLILHYIHNYKMLKDGIDYKFYQTSHPQKEVKPFDRELKDAEAVEVFSRFLL